MLPYLLQMVLVSGMLTAYYWIALRNRRWHGYNRAFLLGTLALSVTLPLVPLGWLPMTFARRPAFSGPMDLLEKIGGAGGGFPWIAVAGWTALVVSGLLSAMCGWRILQVYRLKAKEAFLPMAGYDLIETDDPRTPFSFFNNLFWRRDADRDDPVNRRILRHELAHIEGRHSWDSLFAQLACCLFWMNPFFWILRRELTVVHEFIADAATGMEGDGEGFARMLLQSMNSGRFLEPAQGFFQSPIKRRLFMLCSEHSTRRSVLRKTLALPVIGAVLLFISCAKTTGADATGADAIDQAKLQKEKLDLKLQRLVQDGVVLKLRAAGGNTALAPIGADAPKAGLTPMEEKLLIERKLIEAATQRKANSH